jgi:drug/metabolite transporter (DMT)-like permease
VLGEILSIGAALMWAASTVSSAKALEEVDPLTANSMKTLFSSILMVFIALISNANRGWPDLNPYGLFFVMVAAIIGYGMGDTCLFKSLTLIGVSRSYTIGYSYPLFVLVLAALFLAEPLLSMNVVGTIIVILGIALVSTGKGDKVEGNSKGLLLALAASLLWAIGTIFVAIGLREVDVIMANTFRYPLLFLFLFAISQPWKRKPHLSGRNWALLAMSGVLGMVLGGISFLLGVQLAGVSRATSLSSSSPVWASLMSCLFLKEKASWRIILSSIMVVIGIYFLT